MQSNNPHSSRCNDLQLLVAVAVLLAVALVPGSVFAEPVSAGPVSAEPLESASAPLEQAQYRVRIVVAWGETAEALPEARTGLLERLKSAAESCLGEMWNIEMRDAGRFPVASDWLRRLPERAALEFDDLDKIYFLAVDGAGAGYRLAGREADAATDQIGLTATRLSYLRCAFAQELLALVRQLFRPVVAVEQTRTGTLVRARAGDYSPRDPDWRPLRNKQLLEPYYRYLNAERSVERIQAIPWTYLVVKSAERGRAACDVLSGLRSPLTTRRTRVETLALGVQRQAPSTRVTLYSRSPQTRPVGGVTVDVESDDGKASAKEPPLRLFSDRQGNVVIPVEPKRPQVWISLFSGRALLARLPLAPGLRAEETVELPDDSLRLGVEGEISILQADLVDTVARRAVLMSATSSQARAGDWPQVDDLLKQLAEAPDAPAFALRLSAIQLPAVRAAREIKARSTELRIKKLCEETQGLIAAYLNPDKLRALREEVSELRIIDAQHKAEEEQFEKKKKRGAAPRK